MMDEVKVNVLPELPDNLIAADMSGLFVPEDCPVGEVTIRRGHILNRRLGSVECVMVYQRGGGLDLCVYIHDGREWSQELGSRPTPAMRDAVIDMIGICPH